MQDFLFVIKMFVVTLALVIVFQAKVGEQTIEEHFLDTLFASTIGHKIQEFAHGGAVWIQHSFKGVQKNVTQVVETTLQSDRAEVPGMRHLKFQMERSQEFLNEKAKELKEATSPANPTTPETTEPSKP